MRNHLLLLLVAVPLAACGTWSNDDLVFLAALPDRQQLESKLPGTATAQQALTQDQSEAYRFARDGSRGFNAMLLHLLDLLDNVRSLPPTRREPDGRTWGPYRDLKHPGQFVQLVIERSWSGEGEARRPVYAYRVELGAARAGPWTAVVQGEYAVTGTIREGSGSLILDVDAMRGAGRDPPELLELARLTVDYQTDPSPMTVSMVLEGTPVARTDRLQYDYLEEESGAGAMAFSTRADVIPGWPPEDLDIVAGWLPGGAGKARMTVSDRDAVIVGTRDECWNDSGQLLFRLDSWDPLAQVGLPGECPAQVPAIP